MHRYIAKLIHARKQRIINGIVFAILFSFLPIALDYSYLKLLPRSHWFTYEKIEPISETVTAGTTPRFVSFGEIRKPGQFNWIDVMRCRDEQGDYFYRSYESSAYIENARTFPTITVDPKTGQDLTTSWKYGYPVPAEKGVECYLESSIILKLQFGIKKIQQVRSTKFITN